MKNLPIVGIVGLFSLMILGAVGWIMNIIKLASCDWIISGEEVVRIIGVFIAPIGAVMGYI